ncbi:unnamed protein product [Protopolystoma xenopodis]|uniref:Uncharacterized protein n=1 Tax=Protopolystoma xenopodis TaxID=117903 RepID=A0A3S5AKN9_9PLAT|nr:unnamed protein product [Protopolystoma xenopodis]
MNFPVKPIDSWSRGIRRRLLVEPIFESLHQTLLLEMEVSPTIMKQEIPRNPTFLRTDKLIRVLIDGGSTPSLSFNLSLKHKQLLLDFMPPLLTFSPFSPKTRETVSWTVSTGTWYKSQTAAAQRDSSPLFW